MSLFKSREWWSAQCGSGEEFDRGSLCIANTDNLGDIKIITGGFEGYLRIFSPKKREWKPEDLLLEQNLGHPILQIEAGRFVGHDIGIAILHPRKLSVYAIKTVSGIGDQGSYVTIERKYEHALDRTAGNMTYGPFGGVAGRDFLAVQSMDGMLSVFEQDCPAFARFLPNFLLPGPLCYVAKIDAFVTCNSQMEVISYRYQILASSSGAQKSDSDGGITAAKKLQAEWSLNVGEQVVDIFVSRFSRSLTSTQIDIVVLCERSMFCLKESGAIRFQKRFDYPAACCFPYTVGDSSTSGANDSTQQQLQQNMIVASHLGSLMIYKDMQLIWASKVADVPVCIRVVKIGGLAGLIVTLDDKGSLVISYLGTDPSHSVVNNPVEGKELNYDEMDKELRSLQLLIRESSQNARTEPTDKIVLRAQEVPIEVSEDAPNTTCFRLYISYTGMDSLQNVNIAISTSAAVKVSQSAIVLDSLAGGNTSKTPTVISLIFSCRRTTLPNERSAVVVAAYTTSKGDPRTARLEIMLPLSLFCKIVPTIKTSIYKLTVDTNQRGVPLLALFEDLNSKTDLNFNPASPPPSDQDAPNMISIQYHCGPDVTVIGSKSSGKYRVQSSHFEAMWLLLSELINRLQLHCKERDQKEKEAQAKEPFKVSFTDDLPFQEYFALIDAHFESRAHLEALREELNNSATQFRAIQKRLLVRYKDRNAVPLVNMDLLLEGTYGDITKLSSKIQAMQKAAKIAACNLACATQLVQRLIRYKFNLDDTSYLVLQTYLSARVEDSNTDQQQGWEEATNASLVQLLRTVLAANAQDMATLPVLTALADTKVLKQHIIMVVDRLAAGGKLYKPSTSSTKKKATAEKSSKGKTTQRKPT